MNYSPTHNPTYVIRMYFLWFVCIPVLVIWWVFLRAYHLHGFDVTSSWIYGHYRGRQNLNLTAVWQYDRCGTPVCTYNITGIAYLYMLHVILLRVCTQFYYVQELCNVYVFASHYYPHSTVIIYVTLSLLLVWEVFVSVSDVTDERNIYVGLSPNYCPRVISLLVPN